MEKTFKEHLKNLREVFQRLKDANLVLSPIKSHLYQTKVRYLDHILSRDGVAVDPDRGQSTSDFTLTPAEKEVAFEELLGLRNDATYQCLPISLNH